MTAIFRTFEKSIHFNRFLIKNVTRMASNTSSGSTYDGSMITSGYLKGKVVKFQAQGQKKKYF